METPAISLSFDANLIVEARGGDGSLWAGGAAGGGAALGDGLGVSASALSSESEDMLMACFGVGVTTLVGAYCSWIKLQLTEN